MARTPGDAAGTDAKGSRDLRLTTTMNSGRAAAGRKVTDQALAPGRRSMRRRSIVGRSHLSAQPRNCTTLQHNQDSEIQRGASSMRGRTAERSIPTRNRQLFRLGSLAIVAQHETETGTGSGGGVFVDCGGRTCHGVTTGDRIGAAPCAPGASHQASRLRHPSARSRRQECDEAGTVRQARCRRRSDRSTEERQWRARLNGAERTTRTRRNA